MPSVFAMHDLDLSKLSPLERAARYRIRAEEMRVRGRRSANDDISTAYMKMAAEWLDMARRIEAERTRLSVTVETELAPLLCRTEAT